MKKVKKLVQLLMALAVVITAMQMMGQKAEAAEPPMLDNEEQTMLVCWNVHYPVIVNYLGKYKITGVTSSKKSVIKVCKNEDGSYDYVALKKGRAVLSVKLKKGDKKLVLKKTITVVDDKPFEYIKYGKKDLYKGNEYMLPWISGLKSGKTLTWKLKKGYKVVNFDSFVDGKNKKIKNGSEIKFKSTVEMFFGILTPDKKYITYSTVLSR